jgi:hypothetical protein
VNKKESFQTPACSELVRKAERELGAFISAVAELYGAEDARLSAIDWLDQFESINNMPGSTSHDWRLVTIRATVRLVKRLRVKHPLPNIAVPPTDTKLLATTSSSCFAFRRLLWSLHREFDASMECSAKSEEKTALNCTSGGY